MILNREQIERHSNLVNEIWLHIGDRSSENVLWIDSITDDKDWIDGTKGIIITYTYTTYTHYINVYDGKLPLPGSDKSEFSGRRVVDDYNSPKSHKSLCDIITPILREEKLNIILV